MATYAIGDVQGCLSALQALLCTIQYNPQHDHLWFTGDLANRGAEPLATLRFIKALPHTKIVLGNHDLALLAAFHQIIPLQADDTIEQVLCAGDAQNLIDWLRGHPLLLQNNSYIMTHAGIYPLWTITQSQNLAHEVENVLHSKNYSDFLNHMFGNQPNVWQDNLTGWERLRFITNAFTRMRFCTLAGELNLQCKGQPQQHPDLIPWFLHPNRKTLTNNLIFGHWAALQGKTNQPMVHALDTGCVWGNCLTAFCLETQQRFRVECSND